VRTLTFPTHTCRGGPLSVVYLVKSGDLHKIGLTMFYPPRRRLRDLRNMSAVPVKRVAHAILCCPVMAREVERELHAQFADVRRHGEWFMLERHHVTTITKYLKATWLDARRLRRRQLYIAAIRARANRNAGRDLEQL
jgi:hypothetical protein